MTHQFHNGTWIPQNIRVMNLIKNPYTNRLSYFVMFNILVWITIFLLIIIEYRSYLLPIWNDFLIFMNYIIFKFVFFKNVYNITVFTLLLIIILIIISFLLLKNPIINVFNMLESKYCEFKYRDKEF